MEIKRLHLDKLESEIFDYQPIDPKLRFSDDECYDLDRTMVALLYERLKEYERITEDKGIISISKYHYKDKYYTESEIIRELTSLCLSYLKETSIIDRHKDIWDSIWDIWELIVSDTKIS